MNTKLMFSSRTDDWATPQWLFDRLHAEFNFKLDVAASAKNAKCPVYISEDSLSKDWKELCDPTGAIWMNPPYGRTIGRWLEKAYLTARQGRTVVTLIPARTDTKYWHSFVWDNIKHVPREGVQARFLPGRLKFGQATTPAPFPSVVVVFRPIPL
jgi:phage N-6-adenine-methyltransferase